MAAAFTVLGDGTFSLGETPVAFEGECLNGKITHEYEDIGEERVMLDGTIRPAAQRRTDGFSADLENDLTSTGLYKYLLDNDMTEVPISFTPNTVDGASWAGTVVATLPSEVGSDEHGNPIVSSIELAGVGTFTFTPAT